MDPTIKVVGFGAIGLSSVAIATCIIMLPLIYNEADSLHDSVVEKMAVFKKNTDSTWTQLVHMGLGKRYDHQRSLRNSGFQFGQFNRVYPSSGNQFQQSGLTECSCDSNNRCPAGPPGQPGPRGQSAMDGLPGNPGKRGLDGSADSDSSQSTCKICPVGQPGLPGQVGPIGSQGAKGNAGPSAFGVGGGPKGSRGPPGNSGSPGSNGRPGRKGLPGQNGIRGRGAAGNKGRPGAPGGSGQSGPNGNNAGSGQPGQTGSRGSAGSPGQQLTFSQPGIGGTRGDPGKDAKYCPCPDRVSLPVPRINPVNQLTPAPVPIPQAISFPTTAPSYFAPQSQLVHAGRSNRLFGKLRLNEHQIPKQKNKLSKNQWTQEENLRAAQQFFQYGVVTTPRSHRITQWPSQD